MDKNKSLLIVFAVLFACAVMGVTDAVICPGYFQKSLVKILLFLLLPSVYSLFDKESNIKKLLMPKKGNLKYSLSVGVLIFVIVISAYFAFRNVFDFSGLTESVTKTTGVSKSNFVFVAFYISFVNSFLEEFFFRGFAFLILKKFAGNNFAFVFSAAAFALYHVAMMIGWFALPVVLLSLMGLFAGGLIFNLADRKAENIFPSWIVHMFANFATNTIGFILFAAQ